MSKEKKFSSKARDVKKQIAFFCKILKLARTGILLFPYFISNYLHSQDSNLNKRLDVSFINISLEEVIHQLSKKTGYNFSFNANLLPLSDKISLAMHDKSLHQILISLLEKYKVDFKELNNQIIIYSTDKSESIENNYKTLENAQKSGIYAKQNKTFLNRNLINDSINENIDKKTIYDTIKVNIIDTIHIYDTLRKFISDTVKYYNTVKMYKYDTFKVFDTIKVLKKTEIKPVLKRNTPAPNIYPNLSYDIYVTGQINSFVLKNISANRSVFNQIIAAKSSGPGFDIGATINLIYKHLVFQTGLNYSYKSENWNFENSVQGGYYTKDTISKYYNEIHGTDTTWIYVTRERWIETLTISKYKTRLNYHYFNIPLIFGSKLNFKKFNLEVKGGIISDIFIYAGGEGVFNKDSLFVEKIDNNKIPFTKLNFSGYFAINFIFIIKNNTYLIIGPEYYMNLNSIYKQSYWYSQKFSYPSIKFGIRKKLK